jgi:hypothetical protein
MIPKVVFIPKFVFIVDKKLGFFFCDKFDFFLFLGEILGKFWISKNSLKKNPPISIGYKSLPSSIR